MTKLQRVGFQRPVKYKKKGSTNGFLLFSLTIPLQRKFQASSVIIGKKLKKSETLAKLFPEQHVVAFRRKPCGDKRCKCCLQLQHAQQFHNKTTGKEYEILQFNCKTPNVVYLLDFHVCGSQYVGESVQPFNKRMNGHRSDLTKKTLLPVSQHFLSTGHSLDDFGRSKMYIIDHNPSWKENQRQNREVLDPRVTNITSGGHKQNGLNLLLLFFLLFNQCLVLSQLVNFIIKFSHCFHILYDQCTYIF